VRLLHPVQKALLTLIGIGGICGVFICNSFVDRIFVKLGESNGGKAHPEHRLPLQIGGASVFPVIVALYGWIPYSRWSVVLLLLAVGILGFVVMMIMVPLTSYVVDSFGLYSASAMTMVLIARCLGGTLIPLTIPPLTNAVGIGYGFLILAAICVALVPLPVVVMRYGAHWRQNSVYTRNE